jgi:hypothetical protein
MSLAHTRSCLVTELLQPARRIRASGGRVFVKVEHSPSKYRSLFRAMKATNPWGFRYGGDWVWTVPMPKNHPQPPSLSALSGRAETMTAAVDAGLARLDQLYGQPAIVLRDRMSTGDFGLLGAIKRLHARREELEAITT